MGDHSLWVLAGAVAGLVAVIRERARRYRARGGGRGKDVRTVRIKVEGMMCQKNCGTTVENTLKGVAGVVRASVTFETKIGVVVCSHSVDPRALVEAVESVGFDAKIIREEKKAKSKLRHACIRGVIRKEELDRAFVGVRASYHEQQLQEYSRYKNWTQSCYMECHPQWNPQVEITQPLFDSMAPLLEKCKVVFADWYKELHGLEEVEVITLNSFVTKYVPKEGKDEFGKHVDSAKVDGSLILSLPTDEPHDWPGLIVWDGPKGTDGKRPEQTYVIQPGDVCCLDTLIWHHGLPITKGARYVSVCFY
eukprot:CAMPEP_0203760656 /NCGR_PEP_ID=MMETSP0098-20131031/13910_1 /ASSEMBLY_ACC=CAM_ASM_000208 /TAXON_ID=96639 /ORGANISM=" , Strain NY0313808BC1" /LENGTH=306 /DNA_ID=CAMNT_0050654325 /DNA_START=209 /DNA_END=1126 /DNA_ORIENTATION=+